MSPALTASSSSKDVSQPAPAGNGDAHAHAHAHAQPRARKARAPRRRGPRGRLGGLESDDDDELERERESGSEWEGGSSLADSDSDDSASASASSDAESALSAGGRRRGSHGRGRSRLDTPSTTQSPPPGEVEAAATTLNGFEIRVGGGEGEEEEPSPPEPTVEPKPPKPKSAFLEPGLDWAEMMAGEDEGGDGNGDGDASLPVIEFAELHVHATDGGDQQPASVEVEEATQKALTEAGNDEHAEGGADSKEEEDAADAARRPSSHVPRPARGRGSAHESYQRRLREEPAFVPFVGEFWSHDDRLMQKDFRSLSGWWRNRWTRGHGGFAAAGRGIRGRGQGRGGYFQSQGAGHASASSNGAEHAESAEHAADANSVDVPERPPVERNWTHDGFEEMKARDERRRAQERQDSGAGSRGGFVPRGGRGRGGARGAFSPMSGSPRGRGMSFAHARSQSLQVDRTWFAMKPERIWTKQFEGFLHFEPALKARPGRPAGYRVHLPGKSVDVVRSPVEAAEKAKAGGHSHAPSESATATDASANRKVVVKIPMPKPKSGNEQPVAVALPEFQLESFTTMEQPPVEAVVSSVNLAREEVVQTNGAAVSTEQDKPTNGDLKVSMQPSSPLQEHTHPDNVVATPSLTRNGSLSDNSIGTVPDAIVQVVPAVVNGQKDDLNTAIPPVQAIYSPSQPSPTYGTPYGYPPNVPPGMAVPQPGLAYQMPGGGHPIFLHATPPPPPMHVYNPHPMPFVPGHMHHHHSHSMSHSMSAAAAEFIHVQSAGTPPLNGFVDPTTGQPLFSLPRQSSRIEIRAPGEGAGQNAGAEGGVGVGAKRPSHLRSSTVAEAESAAGKEGASPPVNSIAPTLVGYASAPEFYPRSMSFDGRPGMGMGHAYQPSDGSVSVASNHEDRAAAAAAYAMQDPAMMGYAAGYPQQYYYPEQYYAPYPQVQQQPGQYDPYAGDPNQQVPIYY